MVYPWCSISKAHCAKKHLKKVAQLLDTAGEGKKEEENNNNKKAILDCVLNLKIKPLFGIIAEIYPSVHFWILLVVLADAGV